VFKIECNNVFSIMHSIVSGSSLVINDLVVIVLRKPIEMEILSKAIKYAN
jgi:hypothetical protein